ncbi:MAG TPA: helix-turn-helix domain-containing protein [Marmoricola sp.]|nr:helix-turn-helix domain-containing protein [Marmoricola sp.]
MESPGKRPYSSTVRAESARRTRGAIVSAATRLFVEGGYEGTSLEDVARAAGVARPTVTATFGSKDALLAEVLDQALAGDDAPVPVRERPWFQPVWSATTAEDVLDAYAAVCVTIARRAAPVVEAVHRATDSHPQISALWERWLAGRRAGAAMVVEREVLRRRLRPGLDVEAAIDVLWILNDPGSYALIVQRRGWSEDRFQRWLASSMRALLLDDR